MRTKNHRIEHSNRGTVRTILLSSQSERIPQIMPDMDDVPIWVLHGEEAHELRRYENVLKKLDAFWGDGVPEEIIAAGVVFEDAEVVVDGNLVTSRWPPDLPAFMREMMKLIEAV